MSATICGTRSNETPDVASLIRATFSDISRRSRSALSLARDAPDHVADIVSHQQRAVGGERYADRASVGFPLVGSKEARQNVARGTGWASVHERHQHDRSAERRVGKE